MDLARKVEQGALLATLFGIGVGLLMSGGAVALRRAGAHHAADGWFSVGMVCWGIAIGAAFVAAYSTDGGAG